MTLKKTISFLLAVCVIGLFSLYRHEVFSTFKKIDIAWAGLGLLCFLLNYWFRAIRVCRLTGQRISIIPLGVYCSSLHGFLTYMLPIRSGELSLPFVLKSTACIDVQEGMKILFKARLLDVFVLGLLIIVASITPGSELPVTFRATMFLLGFSMVLSPIVLKYLTGWIANVSKHIRKFVKAVAECSEVGKEEILLSAMIWIFSAVMLWCIAAAMRLTISIDELLFLIAVQLVMQLFPIQGFANSGNHESGWVTALMLIGHPAEVSIQFALNSHAIILVYVIILGLIALVLRRMVL